MLSGSEFRTLSTLRFAGNAQQFIAWLNVVLERTPDRQLTLDDPDVRWLLGYQDAREPREIPYSLVKRFR